MTDLSLEVEAQDSPDREFPELAPEAEGRQYAGLTPLERAAAKTSPHMSMCRQGPTRLDCVTCAEELHQIRKYIAAVVVEERRRQAAYLYAVVQSGEEGEDGCPSNVVEFGYEAGIIYAARIVLDNEAGVNDWPSDASEFELEIRERSAPGKSVVAEAAEWLALREQDDDIDSDAPPVAAASIPTPIPDGEE